LALLLLAALKFARPAWDHARLLHYQSRCLEHVLPADRIVFDTSSQSNFISSDWDRFYAIFSPPGGIHRGTILLHELQRADGARRLVAITLIRPTMTSFRDLAIDLDVQVIQPGTLWSRPRLSHDQTWRTPLVRPFARDRRTRIFAG